MPDELDRIAECQQRIAEPFHALTTFALSQGWTREEIVTAVQELISDWYFDRAADDQAGDEAAAVIERAKMRIRR